MQWRTHILIGAVATVIFGYLLGFHDILFLAIVGGFAALLPDLDHDMSKGRKLLDIAILALSFLSIYLSECKGLCIPKTSMLVIWLAFVGIYFTIFRFFKPKHRGITHTVAAALVFTTAGYLILGYEYAFGIFIGYLSHLTADGVFKLI